MEIKVLLGRLSPSAHQLLSGVSEKESQLKRVRKGLFKHGEGPSGLYLQPPPIVLLFVSSWVVAWGSLWLFTTSAGILPQAPGSI